MTSHICHRKKSPLCHATFGMECAATKTLSPGSATGSENNFVNFVSKRSPVHSEKVARLGQKRLDVSCLDYKHNPSGWLVLVWFWRNHYCLQTTSLAGAQGVLQPFALWGNGTGPHDTNATSQTNQDRNVISCVRQAAEDGMDSCLSRMPLFRIMLASVTAMQSRNKNF